MSSIKLHAPDWLVQQAWLTIGRIRPAHLNIVAYGWCSFAGVGIALWMIPRLLRTPLVGARYAYWGALLWHTGVSLGVGALLAGWSDGMEWLEFPWPIDILLFTGGGLMGLPLALTLLQRKAAPRRALPGLGGAALATALYLAVLPAQVPDFKPGPLRGELIAGLEIAEADISDLAEFLESPSDVRFLRDPAQQSPWPIVGRQMDSEPSEPLQSIP
jgi:hypothetical protein